MNKQCVLAQRGRTVFGCKVTGVASIFLAAVLFLIPVYGCASSPNGADAAAAALDEAKEAASQEIPEESVETESPASSAEEATEERGEGVDAEDSSDGYLGTWVIEKSTAVKGVLGEDGEMADIDRGPSVPATGTVTVSEDKIEIYGLPEGIDTAMEETGYFVKSVTTDAGRQGFAYLTEDGALLIQFTVEEDAGAVATWFKTDEGNAGFVWSVVKES